MLQKSLSQLFERDLDKLKQEIVSYTNEDDVWIIKDGIANSSGNLCLHLVGNLKHYVGKILGGIAYERNRDREFTDKNIPVSNLIAAIDETKQAVLQALASLNEEDLEKVYPLQPLGYEMITADFLIHLYGHLNYHLGQVNYHRRLLNKAS